MITFKEFLQERKTVGTIYHFTKFDNLRKIMKGNKELGLEVLDFISFNNSISCTRNACFSTDITNFDLSKAKGYIVRISLDGTRLSDKYRVSPVLGMLIMIIMYSQYLVIIRFYS